MTDPELVERLRRGEEPAFRMLYERFSARVFNTVLTYLRDRELAEDTTQEVFLRVFDAIGSFDGRSRLSTWIYRIAVNKALDAVRARTRQRRWATVVSLFRGESVEPVAHPPDFQHPGVVLERQEQAGLLLAALDILPERQRTAFVLARVEGLPQQEVAAVLGVSVGAVESLLHRAQAALRAQLRAHYPEKSPPDRRK